MAKRNSNNNSREQLPPLVTAKQQQADRRRRYRAHKKTRHTKKRQRLPSFKPIIVCLFSSSSIRDAFLFNLSCGHGGGMQGNEVMSEHHHHHRRGADTVDFPADSQVAVRAHLRLGTSLPVSTPSSKIERRRGSRTDDVLRRNSRKHWGKVVASIFRDAADQKRFVICKSVGCLSAIFARYYQY